jgi:PAS domain S-box-containing protein
VTAASDPRLDAQHQADNVELRAARRAALNLMEDALTARREAEELNTQLRAAIAERQRAQEALQESEQRFRTMADSMPQLAWIAKADGFIVWYNRRWYEYTGTTPAQMEGWGWQSVHDPRALPKVLEQWKSSIATGEPFEMVFPLRGADGQFRLFLTRGHPLKDAQGRVVQWFGTNTDVEELKRAEEALRASEEKFAKAFADNPAAVALSRLEDGLLLEVNNTWTALNGYTRQEAIGHSAREMGIWPTPEAAREFARELTEKGSIRGREQEFRKKSGEAFVAELSAQLLTVRGEQVVLSTLVDITERKRAQEALKESEQRYRFLFDNMLDGYAYCHMIYENGAPADFVYLGVNEAFERLTGLKDVVGKRVSAVIPGIAQSAPELLATYGRVAQTGRAERFETYLDALQIWFSISVYSPAPEHFVAVFDNITERKQSEQSLRESTERLELALASANMATFDLDIIHNKRTWSAGVHRLLGTDPKTFDGAPEEFYQIIHPDDRAGVQAALAKALATTAPYETEYRAIWPDGSIRHIAARGRIHRDAAGQPVQMTGLCWDITPTKRTQETLKFLIECGNTGGEEFFPALARYLAQSLGMDYVCIDRLEEGSLTAQTLAVHFDGKFEGNVSYALKDTPCGDVVARRVCCFPKDVRHLFPKDQVLADMGAESYVGTTLWNSAGQPIGLIAVLARKPLADPQLATSILELVAVRAGGELERRQAEEALRESETRLNRAQEIAHLGSWELDLTNNRLTWSDEVYRIFGLVPREFAATYEAFLAAVHPEDREGVDAAYAGSLRANKDSYEIEHRVVRKSDGQTRLVHEKCEHVRDAAGRIVRSVGMVHDVTDRKRFERERELTIEFLRLVNEHAGMGNLVQAAATFFQEQSGCAAVGIRLKDGDDYPYYEARGFPHEFVRMENHLCARDPEGKIVRDAAGKPVIECMCGNVICGRVDPSKNFFTAHGSFWSNCTSDLLAGTTDADRQAHTRNRCNGEGYESVALLPLHVGAQRLGLLQLNDKRKGMFSPEGIALLERLADHLAVALAKAEADEDLRRMAEDLKRSNQDLEQFAYVASHDLQEPLRMVTGFMSLLRTRYQGQLDTQAEEYIGFAADGATRMQGLIDDLLAYSRVESRGRAALATPVQASLDRALANLRGAIAEAGATITHDELPTLAADGAQLAQLFQNLIGNALKFRADRPVAIHVGAARKEGNWVFSVRDNGIGIDPQFADRIFMIFQRLHTKEKYPGTGIGLAICKKIVERHGGRIWVESKPGEGSTFCFTLPAQ